MMDRKILAVLVLAILTASGMVAVMADDSDASTSERVSNNNVYRGEFTIPDWRYYDEYYDPFYYNYLYFIEGSENDQTMERYLRDHNVDVTDDDRDRILEIGRSGGSDQKVKVYEFTEYMSSGIWWGGQESSAELVLEAYNPVSFFVKSGNTLEFTVISCVDNMGNDVRVYWQDENWTYHYADPTIEIDTHKSGEYEFGLEMNTLYCDIVYNVSGNSEPNGSSTIFIVVCAAITVFVFALLALAALKPKWSK